MYYINPNTLAVHNHGDCNDQETIDAWCKLDDFAGLNEAVDFALSRSEWGKAHPCDNCQATEFERQGRTGR